VVGILLSPVAVDTWCAVSSRIVTARLKLASAGLRQACGTRCSSDLFLSVISVPSEHQDILRRHSGMICKDV